MKKIISALLILTMIFSIVCVSSSAASLHIDMNFDNLDAFTQQFRAGAFYIDEGVLFGYSEAKALQSDYDGGDDEIFDPHPTCWLTYDASITLSVGDDELNEESRHINVVYCNDNPRWSGQSDSRIFMAFRYDIENRCFRLTEGLSYTTADSIEYMEPVEMEIPTDSEEEITLGISVQKDNIRCFYNNQLIFNYTNPDMLVAKEIVSPFVFWQEGNFVAISNIKVGDVGAIYPTSTPDPTPTDSTTTDGDDPAPITTTKAPDATTSVSNVVVTDDKGNDVTDDSGNKVTQTVIVTDAPVADTNTGAVLGGNSTSTGDVTFIVVAAMVATLGCALIVRKVNVK